MSSNVAPHPRWVHHNFIQTVLKLHWRRLDVLDVDMVLQELDRCNLEVGIF